MSNRDKEEGYVIVEMSEEEVQDILDENYVHKNVPSAGGYAVGDDDEEFVFYKDEPHVRTRAKSQDMGDLRLQADGEEWMALLGGVEDELGWFQAGVKVRLEES